MVSAPALRFITTFALVLAAVPMTISGATAARAITAGWSGNTNPPLADVVTSQLRLRQIATGWNSSCGIVPDGTAICWGGDGYNQALAPAGRFKQLAVGDGFGCGIRPVGSIKCWGGISVAPSGRFIQVADGPCAIRATSRTSGDVVCWSVIRGKIQVARHPGQFTSLSRGFGAGACAIRTDRRLACWGSKTLSEGIPPGLYFSVSVGGPEDAVDGPFACAVRNDYHVVCWGRGLAGETLAPTGSFKQVVSGSTFACGTERSSGRVACWGTLQSPSASLTAMSAGGLFACGTMQAGGTLCFGDNGSAALEVPGQRFVELGGGCALRVDGTLACFPDLGGDSSGGGTLTTLSAPVNSVIGGCAITEAGSAVCPDGYAPPRGSYVQASAGLFGPDCGVTTRGSIQCWGYMESLGEPPDGLFSLVSVGGNANNGDGTIQFACALRLSGRVVCWGAGNLKPPSGRFIQVSAGQYDACGLRWNGNVVCWNENGAAGWQPRGTFTMVDGARGCALRTTGTIQCAGDFPKRWNPWEAGSYSFVGGVDPCGITSAGGVECWGGVLVPAAPQAAMGKG
jgi:hypothetical protein